MAFGKRGLREYEARQQAASARNTSLADAIQSLIAIMDRLIQAGDGAIGYLCERTELTGAISGFDPAELTAAMTYAGTHADLYLVLGHIEPPAEQDFSEHRMLSALAGDLAEGRTRVAANGKQQLPENPKPDELERFGEPVFSAIILQAIVLKHYLSVLALHISSDAGNRIANAEPGIEAELEAQRRTGQTELTAAVRRWASRNMAHHDRAETILMQAKIPLIPIAAGNSAGAGSLVRHGVWLPDELAGTMASASA